MSRSRFVAWLLAVFAVAIALRVVWLRADPPTDAAGVVWHDEGAWVHNARNRALWGTWRTDAWNPVFVAPVFTALEYGAFQAFGVGTWQARTVPVLSGLVAIACLAAGLTAVGGRRVAAVGAALLATNYVFVTWNRAALMESTMTACIVGAWSAYALSERRAAWGAIAGALAVFAWFTKAAAAFFLAALAIDALVTIARSRAGGPSPSAGRSGAVWTIAGLGLTAAVVAIVFVVPHWNEYRFYNWQMSVTRKPEYSLRALVDRASWLPVAQDVFSRSWLVLAAAGAALVAIASRWSSARPAERLLALWVVLGLAELVVHDAGNARRYVMFIPALAGLAALAVASERPSVASTDRSFIKTARFAALPLVPIVAYLVIGSVLRPLFAHDVTAGNFRAVVRLSASLAVLVTAIAWWRWSAVAAWLNRLRVPAAGLFVYLTVALAWDLTEFAAFARQHGERNYEASVALGRLLPSGTLVQGKLANGLSLENQIHPVFVGNGFGNFDDRLDRDDVRFVLTYDLPRIGYESSDGSGLIQGILDRYPQRRVVATFDVDETPDPDRAVLIDKFPAP